MARRPLPIPDSAVAITTKEGQTTTHGRRYLDSLGEAIKGLDAAVTASDASLAAFIAGASQGSVLYKTATDWAWLPPGTSGQVLKTNGAGANPQWVDPPGFTLLSSQATTSGTQFDFNIPSTANEIVLMHNGCSLSGTDNFLLQLGTAGSFISSGYESASSAIYRTDGFVVLGATAATLYTGIVRVYRFGGNIWTSDHNSTGIAGGSGASRIGAGYVDIGAALTRIRWTRTGTNTFDAGSVAVGYK